MNKFLLLLVPLLVTDYFTDNQFEQQKNSTNVLLSVSGRFPLRAAPSDDAAVNRNLKAEEFLGGTHYLEVSPTNLLNVIEQRGDWVLVTTTFPHKGQKGWIKAAALREVATNGHGVRVFTATDFDWVKTISSYSALDGYQTIIAEKVNEIRFRHTDCQTQEPGALEIHPQQINVGQIRLFYSCAAEYGPYQNHEFVIDKVVQ